MGDESPRGPAHRDDDYTFSNGVVGKLVAYHMEERERVKIVNYEGSKQIDRTKIEEQLRERGIELRLDSFVDDGVIRRIKTVLREMMAEKGFTNAEVEHKVAPVAGGPKLVNVTFNVSEGQKSRFATSSSSATPRRATARCRRR